MRAHTFEPKRDDRGPRWAACGCGWATPHAYYGDVTWMDEKVRQDWEAHARDPWGLPPWPGQACAGCGRQNLDTEACPNVKTECIDCCGEEH